MGATFHPPGRGENYELGGSSLSLKAGSAQTGGTLFLSETSLEPGFVGPPLHIHREIHDMFYVLDGELTVQLGEERRTAGPSSFVCVPPETPHSFANFGSGPVRFLNFSTPGGFEAYMRELATAWQQNGGPPAPEAIGAIASNYDFEVVGPALEP
jgi:mannose-6-phosphate isomerase-like protein (cupin superfamily)